MRRRPVVVRRGPGLVGTMARTAVVAGTATVAVKAVGGAMDSKSQAQQAGQAQAAQTQAQMDQMQAQMNQMQAQAAQQPPAAAQPQAQAQAPDSMTEQLQQLAQLKASGILTDDEFQAAKAKILGS